VRKLDRREFIAGAGGAALAGVASPESVFAQPAPAQPQFAMRRAVGTMQPNDPALQSYIRAVERMRALPANNPFNWNNVAQIHVRSCPHSNWFFLPWHRAYLVTFERICRMMSGDPNFTLPYWDWTAQPRLPPAFASATLGNRRNPLFDTTRTIRANQTLRQSTVGQAIITRILNERNFDNFGSTRPNGQNNLEARWLGTRGQTTMLEGIPHNTTHAAIGGDMGDMISPRDPVFWLHHCNVDRLWALWNARGGRNPASQLWSAFRFNNIFPLPQQNRAMWNVGVSDVLDHRAFGYTYPDLPARRDGGIAQARNEEDEDNKAAEMPEPAPRVLASETAGGSAGGTVGLNRVLSTSLTLAPTAPLGELRELEEEDERKGSDNDQPLRNAPRRQGSRVFSVLENITATRGNGTIVNVFLNHPNPTAETPETDPHFVGTFGLFGLQSHASHEGVNMQVEISQAVARLRRLNRVTGNRIDLQVVPVEATSSDLELNLGRVNIVM
jgi:tyrosinase